MRFFTAFLGLMLFSLIGIAQTSHLVETSGLTFSPSSIVVELGIPVIWRNTGGGSHNVNGSQATYPANPESFFSGAPSAANWEFTHVFTQPGTYTYQCDPHAALNMIGFITVNDNTGGDVNLVITEIMYNPPESGTDIYEYVELYNNGTNAVNLNGYTFTGFDYTFNTGYNLGAGEYLLFAVDSAAFTNAFGIPALQFKAAD
ncbi:MAG: lamin tail domain-containing protein [Saprospiraceae bacterium]